jgi:ubiquinone biosynthesis protein COQ9
MDKAAVTKIRDEIIQSALAHVRFDGWTWDVIVQAAADQGYEEPMTRAVFPGGLIDALDSFADYADRAMMAALAGIDPKSLRIRDRIRQALIARYEFLTPHKDAVRQSAAFWLMPWRKPRAAKIVWRTADVIWDWAGDDAKDYNRYTKRGLLSGIILSTTLAWLNDNTQNLEQTKEFLDRRIENVMQLNKVMGKVKRGS